MTELIGRIEDARRRAQQAEAPERAQQAEAQAAHLYAELGRYVHWLMRQAPEALARIDEEARRWAESADARAEARARQAPEPEPVEEVDVDDEPMEVTASGMHAVELTGDSRSQSGSLDLRELLDRDAGLPELDDLEPLPPVRARPAELDLSPVDDGTEASAVSLAEDPSTGRGAAVDAAGRSGEVSIAVRTGSFEVVPPKAQPLAVEDTGSQVTVRAGEDDWLAHLRDLLEVLGPPAEFDAADTGPQGAGATLGRATTNLETRWGVFPDAVQQALLGLVGSRARRLQAVPALDADARLALGRMQRFAEARGLALVPALRGPAVKREWFSDERRYWAVLHAGL